VGVVEGLKEKVIPPVSPGCGTCIATRSNGEDHLLDEMEIDDDQGFDDADEIELDDDQEADEEDQLPIADRSVPVVPAAGCAVSFYTDNKRHHGICLAIIGDQLLLEHKGASRCFLFTGKVVEIVPRLRAGVASATIIVGDLKACRYRTLPKKWLWKLVTTGQAWKGLERGGGLAPSPADLLKGDEQMELF